MGMGKPNVLVLRAAGTNCDGETVHAFELAGAVAKRRHVRELLDRPAELDEFQILALPGGFSYGDDIAAGRILADQFNRRLADPLKKFVDAGKPIIGICNGFQVLLQTDLLPGPSFGPAGSRVSLADNAVPRFQDRWVRLARGSDRCVWTREMPEPFEVPIAHGEGRLAVDSPATVDALDAGGFVALRYADENPNGSAGDVAGLTDETGLVLGLMPHPERYVVAAQHAAWARRKENPAAEAAGLSIFRAGVAAVS
ncbi:MAG: phosphoribosylformylglycinamidine synthase subunit PurQ [Planctomycetota bacterium]